MSEDWSLVYEDYDPAREGVREALCALGNGFFAIRGSAAECLADGIHYPGTYLAGGYNRLVTEIEGRPIENEDLVNVPNWQLVQMRIGDGDWLKPDDVELLDYRQELDLRAGVLRRSMLFKDDQGRTTRWSEQRFVSMADRHRAALAIQITPEDWSGKVTLRTAIDGSVINDGVARYRALNSRHLETIDLGEPDGHTIFLQSRFTQSRLEVSEAARTHLYLNGDLVSPPRRTEQTTDLIAQEISLNVSESDRLVVEKVVGLFTSRDRAISESGRAARNSVADAPRFEELVAEHRLAWQHLWDQCDIEIDCDQDHQIRMKLRLSIFHLLQTVSHNNIGRDVGVPPRSWAGEAYRGHIFWDELFIFPYLNLRMPELIRALLIYRYRRLPAARHAAREAGYQGALYPWQSGSSGREESQMLHLNPKSHRWVPDNTFRQRHINAAITYNVWQYYEVTNDHEFIYFYGAEMMVEIARFWASIASYDPVQDRYEIKGVMGPDEFHTAYPDVDPDTEGGLDNNAYTNVMVAWGLMRTLDALDVLPEERRHQLCERFDVTEDEVEHWDDISRKLKIPFHGDGIISQYEGYEHLLEFEWERAQEKYGDIQRLDRILEAEGDSPNRYKASKQADVLMLFYLFSTEDMELLFERLGYPFDRDTIPRNIDYYIDRTSHGSTLSWMVHSWVLARANRPGSWEMFDQTLDADIDDIQGGTTAEGVHLGAMAGSVDTLQRCYGGIEPRANVLHFNPSLPEQLHGLSMRIRYRRQILEVKIDVERLTIISRQATAAPITVAYRGQYRAIGPGDSCSFRLIRPLGVDTAKPPRRRTLKGS